MTNYHFIGDFHKERSTRIGSSDIPKLFPNPEKPTESLAGYDETALTLYNKKIGKPTEYNYSLAAEMGHTHENKSLELFIRKFFSYEMGVMFRIRKEQFENDLLLAKINKTEKPNPAEYQVGLFRHNTEVYNNGMIAHADCIYLGDESLLDKPKKERYITVEGVTVDKAKPFYIEAKSARKEATKRRNDSVVKGYDFDSTTWQGIPLKHFVQMQYQSSLYNINTGYLALLHNTSEFHVWRVDKETKWQKNIINIVGKMLKHIEMKVPPKEMAICLADIISLYPTLKNDFVSVTGDKAEKIKAICLEAKKADKQIKNWQAVKKDCQDALGVYLKDYDSIHEGSDILVKWRNRTGSKRLSKGVKVIEKEMPNQYRYLAKWGLIKQDKDSRSVDIKFKG